MKRLFIICIYFGLLNASRFYTENSLCPLEMEIPFDQEGKGRMKAQIKNFNPKAVARFCGKSLILALFPVLTLPVIAVHFLDKVHFPVLSAKTEIQDNEEWKKIKSKRGKYSFEYHHRNLNWRFSVYERHPFGEGSAHGDLYEKSKNQKLGFHFDFTDQVPKIFKTLKIRLPFHWSGFDLKWWIRYNEEEREITTTDEQAFKEINLINYFLSDVQYEFSFHVQFIEKVHIRKSDDIDLLTLDYQVIPAVDFNSEQIELLLADGTMKMAKNFVKEYLPSIDMLSRHEESAVVDLRESPVTKNTLEIMQEFVQMTFQY